MNPEAILGAQVDFCMANCKRWAKDRVLVDAQIRKWVCPRRKSGQCIKGVNIVFLVPYFKKEDK
jgi:hypothetical protein